MTWQQKDGKLKRKYYLDHILPTVVLQNIKEIMVVIVILYIFQHSSSIGTNDGVQPVKLNNPGSVKGL